MSDADDLGRRKRLSRRRALLALGFVLAGVGLEILFASLDYFRLVHWETTPLFLVGAAFAIGALRARVGALTIAVAVVVGSLEVLFFFVTLFATRVPEGVPPERVEVRLATESAAAFRVPEDLATDHALLVFYRGWW